MDVLVLLVAVAVVVWGLPSTHWQDTTTSDEDFKRIQEHLNGHNLPLSRKQD